VPHEDTPPTFVTPTDDAPDPFETLQRLTDVMQRVDQEHPDVRLLSAHIAVVVAALLNDSEDVAEENDKLTTQSRKLAARVERLEKTTGRTRQQLNQALAAAGELRTNVNAERRLRRRAEQTRDDAHRLTDVQQRPASNDDELARLQSRLQQAHAEIDKLTTALEDAENDRDTAIRDRALLAARAEERDLTEADEPPQPPAPDSFAEVLARGEHPLLVYSLDRSITDSLDRHPETSAAWCRCVTDAIATMIAYATAKAEARRTGQPAGPALADLRSFARSGDRARISPNRIALSETRAVTGTARYARQRRFPVPRTVDPRGTATVLAHIRIGRRPPAPRLYFLDRTDDPDDGRIYLAYLGPHLDNRLTD
jgi:HAMP domain-containing protein